MVSLYISFYEIGLSGITPTTSHALTTIIIIPTFVQVWSEVCSVSELMKVVGNFLVCPFTGQSKSFDVVVYEQLF